MVAEIETDPTFSRGTLTEAFNLSGFDRGGGGCRYDLAPDGKGGVGIACSAPDTPRKR